MELEEIKEALRLEQESASAGSYFAFFKTRGNMLRFFIILAVGFFSQWSGNGLISVRCSMVSCFQQLTSTIVLSNARAGLDRDHLPGDPDSDQRHSHYLEPRHLPRIFITREQIQASHNVFDIHSTHAGLFHRLDCP